MKYRPHDYQRYTTEFILTHSQSAIFLDCGLGKTVITLTALYYLLFDSFEIRKVLVICPLRVGAVWVEEINKWIHLNILRFAVAIGTEAQRKAAFIKKVSQPVVIFLIG
jgi:SNF2 family DNA or RNA helicase